MVDRPLPPLRQELTLHTGEPQADGAPSWVLHDPCVNRFYQLSWASFEILSRWPLGTAQAVLAEVNAQTTLQLTLDDIDAVRQFLAQHQLLVATSHDDSQWLWRVREANRPGRAMWLLKNYLFFRVPLLRPQRLLNALLPWCHGLFRPAFWRAMAGVLLVALWLVSQRWDAFTHTFAAYGGFGAALGIGLSLGLAKLVHEMGHALTARHFGCRVPAMGVAFLVMVPVLYTDTNDAWKLSSRRQRLLIGGAGMLAELLLAVWATLAWCFLPDGPLRAGVFLLATTTWLATLALNASPFMRFDGYFLLSDWLGMPNLHARAFALARWRLRQLALGLDDPAPEFFPERRRLGLILFAWGTWLYRLVLFLSIAFLVYNLFFKALGIVLLFVELGWFIARPIVMELRVIWSRRGELVWRRETRRSAVLLSLLALWFVLPWQSDTSSPAVLGAAESQGLYAPLAGEVTQVLVAEGQRVRAGQPLARLRSTALEARLALAQARERGLAWQVAQQPMAAELQQQGSALFKEWQAAQSDVAGLTQQSARLQLIAPFAGRVTDLSDALRPGIAIAEGEHLLDVVGPQGVKGEAYVDETALSGLAPGGSARFVANGGEHWGVTCRLSQIDRLNLPTLDQPLLASTYGGPIATELHDQELVPVNAVFRVHLDQCDSREAPLREMTGVARLEGGHRSLLAGALRQLLTELEREAGL
ncbi:HlyD family efflux transporter periplasmic adaptor subunit [Paludibacterium purpuratum]|uniref:Putative peptide zinc metalloprotease protein n=1 Tax=Paludibacterium purpuratum TaxID=1144873 RepID=A0A4R7B2Y0_9NEIS|nr:HlyD family efflux transporter periplasmic adaptor subunit [Paludibacterium purpuratum]TDR77891.1 putative peptide zinc metalloprotease protein [Paludibacterium purpuratum]